MFYSLKIRSLKSYSLMSKFWRLFSLVNNAVYLTFFNIVFLSYGLNHFKLIQRGVLNWTLVSKYNKHHTHIHVFGTLWLVSPGCACIIVYHVMVMSPHFGFANLLKIKIWVSILFPQSSSLVRVPDSYIFCIIPRVHLNHGRPDIVISHFNKIMY